MLLLGLKSGRLTKDIISEECRSAIMAVALFALYLIKPFNINEFSKKLQILIKSKNRRINFSKNAYQFAKKKWSEKQVRIRYKNFLSNLI